VRHNALEAFLGRTSVTDLYTQEEEDAFEYICRHTLLRPRDLMTIGERLSSLRPDERRNELHVKEAVNLAALEIAHEYLAEVAPYVGELDLEGLFARLPAPVLTRDEVDALAAAPDGDEAVRALHALFKVGLLGYVQHDRVRGQWRQRFLRPGDATLDPIGSLPPATHYLVHPVLTDLIGRANPAFLQRVDRANLIGYDKPWRDTAPTPEPTATMQHSCVLKADVHGFGSLMRAGADAPVRRALEQALQRWRPPSATAEAGAGDAVLMVDDDPVAIAQAARHLMDEVYHAPGQPRLRIALHYGPVRTRANPLDQRTEIVGGDAVLCASRVEPVVEPGQIWATEEFREQLLQRPSLWRTTPIPPPHGDGPVNVKKDGSGEPDLWVRLYRLEF